MKFNQTALMAALALMPVAPAFAQALPQVAVTSDKGATFENQVSLHPASLLSNQLVVEFEHRIMPNWSALVIPRVTTSKLSNFQADLLPTFSPSVPATAGIEAGGRWYVADKALKGFFVQPTLSYGYGNHESITAHTLGLHGKAGYQWTIAERAFIHVAGGVQYEASWMKAKDKAVAQAQSDDKFVRASGFLPDMSFGLGVGF